MGPIRHHDHSNTPGAIKRRKAAKLRWTIACATILACAVVAMLASGGAIPVVAAEMRTPKLQVTQMRTIAAVPGKLPETSSESSEESVTKAQTITNVTPEAQASEVPAEIVPEPQPVESEHEWVTVEATAYCSCAECCGEWAHKRPGGVVYTADGSVAQTGVTIAADWDKYPAGTVLYIDGLGERIVQDVGGAIKGNRVDVYFDNHQDALQFGRQTLKAYVVSLGDK